MEVLDAISLPRLRGVSIESGEAVQERAHPLAGMHFTLRQLQVFATVADCGNFTRAAEDLCLTQPAVSQQIRQLTDAVGLLLLEQIGRKVYLTEAGRKLYARWQTMQSEWRAFEDEVSELKGLQSGTLRLAVVSTVKYFVPRLLTPFCTRYPGIEVKLVVANLDQIVERMQGNLDDLYILSAPPAELDLTVQAFLDNPLVMIAPRDHPLAKGRAIPLARLADERFILREAGSGTRVAIERHLAQQNAKLNVRMEFGSNLAIKEAVAAGLGLSILSEYALHRSKGWSDDVAILDVEGFPIHSTWQLVHLRQKQLSAVARAFLQHVGNEVDAETIGQHGETARSA
jgi:DNA-binding transcriptional LysR family regulator